MSSKPLMLDGLVSRKTHDDDDELQQLRRENQRLETELRQVRAEAEEAKAEAETARRVIRNLRDQLNPLHRALRMVFGEIELVIDEETPAGVAAPQGVSTASDSRWESYKATFPGAPAQIIDALLSHRELTLTQLSVLLRRDYSTIKAGVQKLTKAGALAKDGGKGGKIRLQA